jgi:beta-lactamase class A
MPHPQTTRTGPRPQRGPRSAAALLALSCACTIAAAQPFTSPTPAPWSLRLAADLPAVDARHDAEVGVYVRDLNSDAFVSYKADKSWYIASMVKVPVAIAVLRGIDAGAFTLDTTLRLRASDYVDGGGSTISHPLATALPIRYLMEQMIIHSDNTASDMLIDLVGAAEVNATVASLVPQGFGRITALAEVRRQIYGQLTPAARHLGGADLIALNRIRNDRERLELLSQITGVPVADFNRRSLDAAYSAYYASGLNSARLDAYAQLLTLLAQGKALGPESTRYLLGLMALTATGPNRLKAGLEPGTHLAHKTGTQRGQVCDAGLLKSARLGEDSRVIVVACARGEKSLARSESALRDVGNVLCRSGLLNHGVVNAPSCDVAPRVERLSVDASPAAELPASHGR